MKADFTKEVELDDELKEYLNDSETLGQVLQHPLVYSVPYWRDLNGRLNEGLKRKKESLAKAVAGEEWETAIWVHERPWRINAFIEYMGKMPEKEYWRILGLVWEDSEGPGINKDVWLMLFSGSLRKEKGREENRAKYLMKKKERLALAGMDDLLTLYRGTSGEEAESGEYGLSWTTDIETARFFAKRFKGTKAKRGGPAILRGGANKGDVWAYRDSRKEKEIIVNPDKVFAVKKILLDQ